MNLETLAQLGEFIGGVAVLVTIIYLAFQTRQTRLLMEQSNKQQAASMLRANIDGWNHTWASILGEPDAVSTFARIRAGQALSEDDRQRAELIAYMLFLNLENFILQNAMNPFVDGVDKFITEIIRHRVMEVLGSPDLESWWDREKIAFGPQFRDQVDAIRREAE